jgi:hypothetical protein
MTDVRRLVELSMVPPLAKEVAAQIDGATSDKSQVTALTPLTVTATTGTLPTPNGSVTIADAATPTVVELQEFCVELNAKINALVTALKA